MGKIHPVPLPASKVNLAKGNCQLDIYVYYIDDSIRKQRTAFPRPGKKADFQHQEERKENEPAKGSLTILSS
jgi:hypothetical protein